LRIVNPARIDSDVVTVGKDTEPGRDADSRGHERYFGRSGGTGKREVLQIDWKTRLNELRSYLFLRVDINEQIEELITKIE